MLLDVLTSWAENQHLQLFTPHLLDILMKLGLPWKKKPLQWRQDPGEKKSRKLQQEMEDWRAHRWRGGGANLGAFQCTFTVLKIWWMIMNSHENWTAEFHLNSVIQKADRFWRMAAAAGSWRLRRSAGLLVVVLMSSKVSVCFMFWIFFESWWKSMLITVGHFDLNYLNSGLGMRSLEHLLNTTWCDWLDVKQFL